MLVPLDAPGDQRLALGLDLRADEVRCVALRQAGSIVAPAVTHRLENVALLGAVAALAFTPLDVLRVRTQLRPRAFPALDVVEGLRHIATAEGSAASLWRGAGVNVCRAAVLSAAQLSTYDAAKRRLRDDGGWAEGLALHLVAAICAGVVAQTAIQPFDAARTTICAGDGAAAPFASARRTPAALLRGYRAGLARQGPVLALTLGVTERARAALGLAPM